MVNSTYPYPTYVPNKVAAGCAASIVGISLIAWLIQSIQTRFRPRRASVLLLASHLAIFCELIVRAAFRDDSNSKLMFSILTGLFTVGVRMTIMANFSFVLEVHHEQTRLARGIFLGATLLVVTSAVLMIPANMSSFDAAGINTSFLYRKLSASVLVVVTVGFYAILYWSQTIKDMTFQAISLIMVSSTWCLVVAIVNLIEAVSLSHYEEINNQESLFYAVQMVPIIFAHVVWSSFHPKRSLKSSETSGTVLVNNQQLSLK